MRVRLKVVSWVTALALSMSHVSLSAAPSGAPKNAVWDTDACGNEIRGFDGQAYCASRYVPSVRPQVIAGALAIIAILVVYFQNREGAGSGDHAHGK